MATSISIIFFNDSLERAIIGPLKVILENLQRLFYIFIKPNTAYGEFQSSQGQGSNTTSATNNMLPGDYLNENYISIKEVIESFPIGQVLLAISFSIILYFFLVSIKTHNDRSNIKNVFGNSNIFISNIFIIAVLIFSLFLVVSVCITIPYLSLISKPTPFTITRLDTTLNEYSKKDIFTLSGLNPNLFPLDTASKFLSTDPLKTEHQMLPKYAKEIINGQVKSFNRDYGGRMSERLKVLNDLNIFIKSYPFRELKYRKSLSNNFEEETQSIIVDKAALFQSSVKYFSGYVFNQQEMFERTIESIEKNDLQNKIFIQIFFDELADKIHKYTEIAKLDNPLSKEEFDRLNPVSSYILRDSYQSYIIDQEDNLNIPKFLKNGSEWRVFGFIANYLIKTQSFELVLLMGMFGFGLLGASLFSFQTLPKEGNVIGQFNEQLLIVNFGSVLARGFGAALVIYLATKGGLAIFSAGTSTDANGYILLLTCFVGAVYSEKVWLKIQKTLYPDVKSTN